jgi:hypothetical protein
MWSVFGVVTCVACAGELEVHPSRVTLQGKSAQQRLLVWEAQGERSKAEDLSRSCQYRSETPAVVAVSADGVVVPVASGKGTITVLHGDRQARVEVEVIDGERPRPVTFERDIEPILTRLGCNSGPCHGKARGQGGFQLSLLGFDREFDYAAIAHEARGRRVFPEAAEFSLLLRKPTGQQAHGGGKRLERSSPWYEALKRWIEAGLPRTPKTSAGLERIVVEPSERILPAKGRQQLVVTAVYADGVREDVTHLATFQSSESVVAAVSVDGLISAGALPGEAAVMARFQEKFAVCNVTIPLAGAVPAAYYDALPRKNFVDPLVYAKLQKLGLKLADPVDDAKFLRRAHLDLIGRLPTPDELTAFLADKDSAKRDRLVERLLERPEYADFMANKWADLLRPNPYRVGIKSVWNFDAWLRKSFRDNRPYDQFVRDIITARGSIFRDPATVVFRDRREPDEITTLVSQIFLGIRLDCARCHHHPFEIWGVDDFYGMAAYFARIGRKGNGVGPPVSPGEEILFTSPQGEVKHPLTGQPMPPRPLFGQAPVPPGRDPRDVLADWIVSKDNPYFARVLVNRVWADLMGRGLVEPVDDLRATNPPSNAPLLDALAEEFHKQGYDIKKLIRTIATSHVYGLQTRPSDRNASDARNFSRAYRQRLRAEVLLDAVCDVTDVPEKFAAMPLRSRAMQLWTTRAQSAFLDSFGRPDPNQDPPCERTSDSTVVQALHLMNSPELHAKISHDEGRAARLAASKATPAEIVEELYARIYCRRPSADEQTVCLKLFDEPGANRRRVVEDIMWALLNTPEFVFRD